jgi:hypothetical protein
MTKNEHPYFRLTQPLKNGEEPAAGMPFPFERWFLKSAR